ncbi:hypothetical protein [Dictyobacter vulcani]|uniref:hypothetical protein n=1 Tax=Dictyobacter vulcani TaxID=2607529 RepID=UPI001250442F|nr:hypothetical protein [Dictyobacter vulcani]
MKRIQTVVCQLKMVISTWKRVLILFWKVSPWIVIGLLAFTIGLGLLPAMQIQVTSYVVQSVASAIYEKGVPEFVSAALLAGLLQGGLAILSLLLTSGQQYLQSLLQMQLSNVVSFQIMEKAASLTLQQYEDDELYDRMQRANRESMYVLLRLRWRILPLGGAHFDKR